MQADLSATTEDLNVSVVSDGTTTVYEITGPGGGVVGRGVAKRRKGDRRNIDVGVALAAARAHAEMADGLLKAADFFLEGGAEKLSVQLQEPAR